MMNSSLCERNEAVVIAPANLTELVRGDEQELLDRVGPMVREHSIELDLGKIDRIDAAGISALISLYTRAHNAGHAFSVRNVPGRVAEILKLVGLEAILVSHNAVPAPHAEPRYERSAA
jgi:anti-anti-sigma regulatory factor